MDTKIDEDGDLLVQDGGLRCFVFVSGKNNDRLRMVISFGFKDNATPAQKLSLANRINQVYIIARAFVTEGGNLGLDYYLPLAGGMPAKTFLLATKRFMNVVREAVNDADEEDVVR